MLKQNTKTKVSSFRGFTLVELLIVISVLGMLTALVVTTMGRSKERSYFTKAKVELSIFGNATKLYTNKYNDYPPDTVDAGIPSEIKEFIHGSNINEDWPKAPWPGSLYDYEAWDVDRDGNKDTYQVSIRFCTYTEYLQPNGEALCISRKPNEPWAEQFNSNNNAVYYCLKGYCRANEESPLNTPAYCINCPQNKGIRMPNE